MTARSASAIAAANNRKGKVAEQEIAKYLRTNGFPNAERTVRTGYNTGARVSRDQGDITACPEIVIQSKYTQTAQPEAWIADAADQAQAAGADIGIVVYRRQGKSDPGRWWAIVTDNDISWLMTRAAGVSPLPPRHECTRPTWRELGDLVALLRSAGYGQPAEDGSVVMAS